MHASPGVQVEQALPFAPHALGLSPAWQRSPAQQPVQEDVVQRQPPSKHSWPASQEGVQPAIAPPPPVPQVQLPKNSDVRVVPVGDRSRFSRIQEIEANG